MPVRNHWICYYSMRTVAHSVSPNTECHIHMVPLKSIHRVLGPNETHILSRASKKTTPVRLNYGSDYERLCHTMQIAAHSIRARMQCHMPHGAIQHDLALGTASAFKGPEEALLLNQQLYCNLLLHQPDTCTLNAKYLKDGHAPQPFYDGSCPSSLFMGT